MPDLPWDKFLALPGDPRKNWEILCREVIRRHYERFGPLLTRKQQPGVEFHLEVQRDGGELGDRGRHWGWQCKWFEPDAFTDRGVLRADQRRSIEAAIAKSAKYVPGLSDWVLWTREKLGADDARWFEGLKAPFTLRLWDEETLIGLLNGEAEILRQTWFGELVLDEARLTAAREEALAPIAQRYVEELHVRTPSEDLVRAFLPDLRLSPDLLILERLVERTQGSLGSREGNELITRLAPVLEIAAAALSGLREGAERGELATPGLTGGAAAAIDPDGEVVQMLGAQAPTRFLIGRVKSWLTALGEQLAAPVIVAVGSGGAGKTHLAAALSGPDGAARGVLVLGRQFGTDLDGDELARATGLADTRDQLLEALEAYGARQGRRVALVIDGLNESDDPRRWQETLARLGVRAARLPHVVVVATIRPSYRAFALPPGLPTVELIGLTGVEAISIERYFTYYKIDASAEAIHWWRPADPLLLSIFCKTVNPERERPVGTGELPQSLHEVFEDYLEDVCTRIAGRLKVEVQVVNEALDELALDFFDRGARELTRAQAGAILGDGRWTSWENSLRFHLEAEGILVRDAHGEEEELAWSYDMLAGYAIATAIAQHHRDPTALTSPEVRAAIEAHPLREDIVGGLSGVLAARGVELTAIFAPDSTLGATAALAATRLAAAEVPEGTLAAIEQLFAARPQDVLDALAATSLAPGHPLNATLLDRLLGGQEVWKRDLGWSEWVRGRSELVLAAARRLGEGWRRGEESTDDDAALAWLSWLLTSTDKPLRDEAIYALYRFGRREPERLFARALQMLGANDPAIAEGLMAASYGVAMAAQDPSSTAGEAVLSFAAELDRRLLGGGATQPTSHWLIREYAYRTTQLAGWLSGGEFPARGEAAQPPLPQPAGEVAAFEPDDGGWQATAGAFRMDFSNYTIGRLVEDRANYQDDHPRFQQVTGEIRARVAELGWSEERFGEIDREIGARLVGRSNDPEKVERYGKKYSWAGFYEAAGRLSDRGELLVGNHTHEGWRLADLPIDPSFPLDAKPAPFEPPDWLGASEAEDEAWVRGGETEIPEELLRTSPAPEEGPWIVVDGFVRQEQRDGERRVFCFIRGVLALSGWSAVEGHVAEHGVEPELVPNNASDYYCFAGEVPWAPTFDSYATAADGSLKVETTRLGRQEDGPEVELVAVEFNWESYHSTLNAAAIGSLPSKAFARFAGLRKLADRPEFVDAEGRPAVRAVSLGGDGRSGHFLYVRQDLLEAYCRERGGEWGWVAWGERELMPRDHRQDAPAWLIEARQRGEDRFARVVSLDELSTEGP